MEISSYTKVVITGEDRSGSAFESLKRKTIDTERSFERLKSVMSTLGVGISFGGAFALLKEGVQQFLEAEKSINRLNAVLQTTQHSAGLTAHELERLTQSISKTTLIDDEQIRDGITQMLIFKNVTGDVAKEAITLGANYAAAFGGDVASAMQNIGRALESPVEATRTLRSLNILLSDSQQELIKNLIETGDMAGAQGFILDQLRGKYGDLADEINKGPLAESKRLTLAWDELLESLGRAPASTGVQGWLADVLDGMKRIVDYGTTTDFLLFLNPGTALLALRNINAAAEDAKSSTDFTQLGERFGLGDARLAKEGAARKKANQQLEDEADLYKKLTDIQLANMSISEAGFAKQSAAAKKFHSDLESLLEQDAYVKLATDVGVLDKALSAGMISQEQYNKSFDAMIGKLPEVIELNKDFIGGLQGISKEELEGAKTRFESVDAFEKQIQAMQDELELLVPYDRAKRLAIETQKLLALNVGLTADQVNNLAVSYVDALEKLSASKDAIAAQKEIQDEMKRTADAIRDDLTDALLRGFESGKDFAQNFRDTLVNIFQTLVLRPTIQGILAPVGGALAGLAPGSANAAGGGFGLNNLSSLGNLFGGSNPLTSLGNIFGFGSAASSALIPGVIGSTTGVAATFGTGVAGVSSLTASGAAGAGAAGLGAFAAAVPWLAIAAIAIPLISGLFDDGPADRTAKFVTGRRGTNPRFSTDTPFGITGISEDRWFSGQEMGQALDAFIAGISTTDKQIVEQLNLSTDQITAAKLNLEDLNNKTYSFGTEHEGIEGLTEITRDRYSAIFKAVNEDLSLLVANYDQADDKIGEYITGAVQLYKALDKVGESMPELSKSLLAFASLSGQQLVDTAAIINYASADPIKDAAELVRLQSRTLTQVWNEQGTELRKLISEYDGSATATSQLAALTQSRYQVELQLAQQIMQVLDASHTLFASSAEQIRFSVLSETEKYNSLRNKSLELEGILASATDPAKIYELSQQLNEVTTQAFGLLTAEQQKQQAEPFAKYLEGLDSLVQTKLEGVQATLSGEHDTSLPSSIASAIEKAMEKAAAKFLAAAQAQEDAASKQQSAASAQQEAANTPIRVDARVTLAGSEVGR